MGTGCGRPTIAYVDFKCFPSLSTTDFAYTFYICRSPTPFDTDAQEAQSEVTYRVCAVRVSCLYSWIRRQRLWQTVCSWSHPNPQPQIPCADCGSDAWHAVRHLGVHRALSLPYVPCCVLGGLAAARCDPRAVVGAPTRERHLCQTSNHPLALNPRVIRGVFGGPARTGGRLSAAARSGRGLVNTWESAAKKSAPP